MDGNLDSQELQPNIVDGIREKKNNHMIWHGEAMVERVNVLVLHYLFDNSMPRTCVV